MEQENEKQPKSRYRNRKLRKHFAFTLGMTADYKKLSKKHENHKRVHR